jgi:transcription-repair coupling factor (superfamily II helicase)
LSLRTISKKYEESLITSQIVKQIIENQPNIGIPNLIGSSLSFFIVSVFKKVEKPFLLLFKDKEEAAYYLNDLEQLVGENNLLFFPGSYRRPYQIEETDNANILLRTEVLNRVNSRRKPAIIVSYYDALFEQVITKSELNSSTLKIHLSDKLSLDFINEVLFEYEFNKVDFVSQPGEFAVRGGIIDVFSYSHDEPYRIEFFGDEVDCIRTFDVETQLSSDKVSRVSIMPDVTNKQLQDKRQSFLQYLGNKTLVWVKNKLLLSQKLDKLFQKATLTFQELNSPIQHTQPESLFIDGKRMLSELATRQNINFLDTTKHAVLDWKIQEQPTFNKQFNLLIKNFQENTEKGFANYLFCDNKKQAQRFHDIFSDIEEEVQYKTLVFPLYLGFIDPQLQIACYTDHQIFGRYHKFRLKTGFKKKQAVTLKELTALQIGDYVTHIDHGIGKFGGLQKIDVEGKPQEAIKLMYGDRDILYISIHSLHKISKYNGKDGSVPKIYKLGSGAWKKLKQKTKKRVKEIAFDLIQLYAKRKQQKGFQYHPDSYMQLELEASFMYEDTPDQYKATQDIKDDMESTRPMDRLVCGDVGFGKTEVAIRAAFKAVDNGLQVAVLVPTTILAFQHFRSFQQRLKDFPVRVDYLNRFRTSKQRREVLEGLKDGSLDIVIGTHQLVNKAVVFKNLGLLIVDEEQKFGVGIKDKLKTIKENVDTLTLTATPIPRTLQFSLMAARDLSLINTPPPNRHPIDTQVIRFNKEIIRDALHYEISRGGQIFFINNRIENIKEVAGMLQRLLPDAKIGIGHGQMDGKKLEKLMLAFINNEFDILVSTTIVENGLDVPNANTIFINNANNFGLSDLHQMRGRVGRSNKKAFCYLITPPYDVMTPEARKRVEAIQLFSDLGSGFNIAMKDLEIRGAGDLLGGEQSGFINDIGFETYQKILNEAIDELKETEFKDLYNTKEKEERDKKFVKEIQIDTDLELLIPDDYISIISERLRLYTELSNIENIENLQKFEKNLSDRFGELPIQVEDLLLSLQLKWQAQKLGIEKLVIKKNTLIGYFIADQQAAYYNSPTFRQMLYYVQKNPSICTVKEKQTKKGLRLLIRFDQVKTVKKALGLLSGILT